MWSTKLDEWRAAFNRQRQPLGELTHPNSIAGVDTHVEATNVVQDDATTTNVAPDTAPAVSAVAALLPTQRPSRGDFFTWERQMLRYMWQVKLETLQHQHVERDERSLLGDMLVQEHVAAIAACVLHELRVRRGIACNGPTTVNVRNWFKKRANPESWDKPYHPRHYKAYVRRQALDLTVPGMDDAADTMMDVDAAEAAAAAEHPHADGQEPQAVAQRLSFLKLLQQAVPLNSPQDILRLEDIHYFATRMHNLLDEARTTNRVLLPLEQRTRVRAGGAGPASGVFSERVLRLLLEAYHQPGAARTWLSYSNPSDPTQMHQLAALRERINVSVGSGSLEIESRASHANWFRRPIINHIDDVQQIIKWTRRRLIVQTQAERDNINANANRVVDVSVASNNEPRTWLDLVHNNDQMLQHCRMMCQFVGRPLCGLVLPYALTDANAMVSPAHPLSSTLRFLWQVPPSVLTEHSLPRNLAEAQLTQTKLRNLSGAHLVQLARTWTRSCFELQGDEDRLFWNTLFVRLQHSASTHDWSARDLLTHAHTWFEEHGATHISNPAVMQPGTPSAKGSVLHWCGLRMAFICGCQSDVAPGSAVLLCAQPTHESAWRRLQRIVFWLELVDFLTRHGDTLAAVWHRVLVQKNVDVPLDANERKAAATSAKRGGAAQKVRKDLVLRAFMQLLDEWLWQTLPHAERINALQLTAYGFLMHLEFFASVVKHLLEVNKSKSVSHLPHFGLTLEMCAGNVFQWLLTMSDICNAQFMGNEEEEEQHQEENQEVNGIGENELHETTQAEPDAIMAADDEVTHRVHIVPVADATASDLPHLPVVPNREVPVATTMSQIPAVPVRASKPTRLFSDNDQLFAGLLGNLATPPPVKKG